MKSQQSEFERARAVSQPQMGASGDTVDRLEQDLDLLRMDSDERICDSSYTRQIIEQFEQISTSSICMQEAITSCNRENHNPIETLPNARHNIDDSRPQSSIGDSRDSNAKTSLESFESITTNNQQTLSPSPTSKMPNYLESRLSKTKRPKRVVRKFKKLDASELTASPAPDVKIGQRIAYKEYYGNEFGTIRWIGRVPQISPDWTAGVEFDNAIGEGDGSLNGRRYFIAKDCFAKFLPLNSIALVDQHVGRPEPGTMISVMSAASRPGQLISIQRVSTVHVQHCFLNAPHRRPGPEIPILAVNNRLHCQCPNCGPCAHVIKPPRTQRLARPGKNATHMCQFSTYTCCGMQSQEEALCTYTGNKPTNLPPFSSSVAALPPIGNSWIAGSGYLTMLQAQQIKSLPDDYRLGAAPEDGAISSRRLSKSSSRRSSSRYENQLNQASPSDVIRQRRHSYDRRRARSRGSADHRKNSIKTLSDEEQSDYEPLHNRDYRDDGDLIRKDSRDSAFTFQEQQYDASGMVRTKNNYLESKSQKHLLNSNETNFRNSIDNKYLYATDEPIDSTLEADLERLSQARYGAQRGRNACLIQSKNILKSLKNLISCLRMQSTSSDLRSDFESPCDDNLYPIATTIDRHEQNLIEIEASPDGLEGNDVNSFAQDYSLQMKQNLQLSNHESNGLTNQDPESEVKQQVSSSSDCGFSSASQNSNTAFSPLKTSSHRDQIESQVYMRIASRLLRSSLVSHEDTLRLYQLLDLDQRGQEEPGNEENRLDETIADIIRNLLVGSDDADTQENSSEVSNHELQEQATTTCQDQTENVKNIVTDSNDYNMKP